MRTIWILGLLFTVGCSAVTKGTGPATVESAASAGDARAPGNLGIIPILPAVPARPLIDLGPLLIPRGASRTASLDREYVMQAAEDLRADAIVYEERELREVYPSEPIPQSFSDAHPVINTAAKIGLFLLSGRIATGSLVREAPTKAGFYRAIRYAEPAEVGAIAIGAALPALEADLKTMLENLTSLAGQLDRSHQLLSAGFLDIGVYRDVRAYLAQAPDAGLRPDSEP